MDHRGESKIEKAPDDHIEDMLYVEMDFVCPVHSIISTMAQCVIRAFVDYLNECINTRCNGSQTNAIQPAGLPSSKLAVN